MSSYALPLDEKFTSREHASETIISPSARRRILVTLSVIGCICLLFVASNDSTTEQNAVSGDLVDNEIAEPIVLQERSTALETALRRLKKTKGKRCDRACELKKKRIREAVARKMKQLRDQINDDFSSMIDFGHKAGYLPPPKSIKEQVMSGTLLNDGSKTGSNAVPPPPFKLDPSSLLTSHNDDSSQGEAHQSHA
eukprot:CAMPEP_0113663550 /NCGR_PEP_ID=MMETSP0038_2-20120614/1213_1 /TAXON_ID=2898 /ORGANISM="Cryptomonas paramecium" /LENGTH=195 /DNA_ID=CAMNT_0000578607 /DNA_START=111 /DNA_END=695 /DNA_ORIENTATION=- /assembly_acc=CAM_ASM_000170